MGLISVVCSTVKLCLSAPNAAIRTLEPLPQSFQARRHYTASELYCLIVPQSYTALYFLKAILPRCYIALYCLRARLPYTVSELDSLILPQSYTALYCLRAMLPYTVSELCCLTLPQSYAALHCLRAPLPYTVSELRFPFSPMFVWIDTVLFDHPSNALHHYLCWKD